MEDKAVRGVPWTLLTYGANRGLFFLTTLVLAQLLEPSDFGVVALATTALLGLALISDVGFPPALIVVEHLDEARRRTALTLGVGLGFLAAAVIVAVAPLTDGLLGDPRLPGVLAALGACVPCFAFIAWCEALFQRELEFRPRFQGQIVQSVVYAVVALGLAAAGVGLWSLVVGQVASLFAQSLTLVRLLPGSVRPGFDRAAALELVRAGRGFMAQSWLVFATMNADTLIVGRVLGTSTLGSYSMSYRLSSMPYQAVADPISRVTFPAFARMRQRGEDLGAAFYSSLRLIALVTVPAGVLLSATAEPLVRALFGSEWLGMIGPLVALGIWGALRTVQGTVGWLCNSLGAQDRNARVTGFLLIPLAVGAYLAADASGAVGVAWVLVAHNLAGWVWLTLVVRARSSVGFRGQLAALLPALVGGVAAWLSARFVADAFIATRPVLVLGAAVGAGLAAYAVTVLALAPELPRQTAAQVRRLTARPVSAR